MKRETSFLLKWNHQPDSVNCQAFYTNSTKICREIVYKTIENLDSKSSMAVCCRGRTVDTPPSKKKATFYLPEDLLRATRVHAARTDKRESQVVEDALRAHLGFGADGDLWGGQRPAPAPEQPGRQPRPTEAPQEPAIPVEPMAAAEGLALATAELHAMRAEARAGRP
jgi:hypothetical protein